MRAFPALPALLLLAFAASEWRAWLGHAPRPRTAVEITDATASTSAPIAPTSAPSLPAPAPAVTATPGARELLLPDGNIVPTLNGAEGAPPLAKFWAADRPWSPIVGVRRSDAGVDWYQHADGSYSTTEMKWRDDLGRLDAMTRVAHPGDAPTPPARETRHARR